MGTLVEESLRKGVRAFSERDPEMAQSVIDNDDVIDQMEVDVEEDCLKILALHQPVAIDLRFIISVLKINNDLERIADLAANIAERALFLATTHPIKTPDSIPEMAQLVQEMLKKSLDALVEMDATLALQVCASDDEVDDLHSEMYPFVQSKIES
ncbi:MAG: phosphate signaling complex protein PhoU, partial [bacterium]